MPSSTGSSWKRPLSSAASSVSSRRALVTEVEQEPEAEVDEACETIAVDEDAPEDFPAFEEYLLNEAEVLASELKDAEECGIDAQVLEELEADFEQAAETFNHEGSTLKGE